MSSLYKHPKVKGLISLTHGEGFGLPLLEAAACGLPVCATNWSAHTEFLNLGDWTKVKGRLEPVPQRKLDQNIWVDGAKWANCDISEARKSITSFVLLGAYHTVQHRSSIQFPVMAAERVAVEYRPLRGGPGEANNPSSQR